MSDIVERLNENIISDAFECRAIVDGALCERLIRERKEAADEIERLRAEHKMAFEAVGDVVNANDALRAENEKLREESITSSGKYYDIGYACAKDMQKDKIEMLREALIGLYKPIFENPVEVGSDLDLALRAAAAAIRESKAKP